MQRALLTLLVLFTYADCEESHPAYFQCRSNPLLTRPVKVNNNSIINGTLLRLFTSTLYSGTGQTRQSNSSTCPSTNGLRTCCTEESLVELHKLGQIIDVGLGSLPRYLLDLNATAIFNYIQAVACHTSVYLQESGCIQKSLYNLTDWDIVRENLMPYLVQIKAKSDAVLMSATTFGTGLSAYAEGLLCLTCDPRYGSWVDNSTVSLSLDTCDNLSYFFVEMLNRVGELATIGIHLAASGLQQCCEQNAFHFLDGQWFAARGYCSMIVAEVKFLLKRHNVDVKQIVCDPVQRRSRPTYWCKRYLCDEVLKGLSLSLKHNYSGKPRKSRGYTGACGSADALSDERGRAALYTLSAAVVAEHQHAAMYSFGSPSSEQCPGLELDFGSIFPIGSKFFMDDRDIFVRPALELATIVGKIVEFSAATTDGEIRRTLLDFLISGLGIAGVAQEKPVFGETTEQLRNIYVEGCESGISPNQSCPVMPHTRHSHMSATWFVVAALVALSLVGAVAAAISVKRYRNEVAWRNRECSTARAESFLRDELQRLRSTA